MKTKVQVKDLRKGDELSSGAQILGSPTADIKDTKKYIVPVKYKEGRSVFQSWGKYTTVTVTNR